MTEIGTRNELAQKLNGGSGRGKSYVILWVIVGLLIAAITWASVTEIDEVARGSGKVVASKKLQQIQTLEGGVVREVMVNEGEIVSPGQVLATMDRTSSLGELQEMKQRWYSLVAQIERFKAEMDGKDLKFPPEIVDNAPAIAITQRRLFEARRNKKNSELAVLDNQHEQRRSELEEAEANYKSLGNSIELSQSEIDLIEPLVERNVEPEVSLIKLKRAHSELLGQREVARQQVKRFTTAIEEIERRENSVRAEFESEILQQLSEVTAELAELEKVMPAKRERLAQREIKSQVHGVVNRVLLKTIGAVAKPGDTLLEIVPIDGKLMIEANIRPEDIAFLRPGQDVNVKVTAYDFVKYGMMDGELLTIGADAVEVPETEQTMYPVQVRVDSVLKDKSGKALEIIPGMVVQIDILTGKRRIVDYILEPVTKVRHMAFREN